MDEFGDKRMSRSSIKEGLASKALARHSSDLEL